jgi:hypothetical protein
MDYKRRAGLLRDSYPIQFPGIIGVDIAGMVVKIGLGSGRLFRRRPGVRYGGR